MLRLIFADESTFPAVRELRYRVFHGELGAQEPWYLDMYNDHLSKVLAVYDGERLVATGRLVFGRDTQKYYISYLTIDPEHRKRSHFGLLMGGIFHIMRVNGIQAVYADVSRENLPMYLALGCRVIGPWYDRHGFSSRFAPIVYELGSNAQYEDKHTARALQFLPEAAARWHFDTRILLCSSLAQYRALSDRLLEHRKILGALPHLGNAFEYRNRHIRAEMIAAPQAASETESHRDPFPAINARHNDENVMVVRRDSPLAAIARTYAVLSGKQLHEVERWSEFAWHTAAPESVLLLLDDHETGDALGQLQSWLQHVAWGMISVDRPETLSRLLLETYLSFCAPVSDDMDAHPRVVTSLDGCTSTHAILVENGTIEASRQRLDQLLREGYPVGAAVQKLNSEPGGRHVLFGDPSLRCFPEPSHAIEPDLYG